MEDLLAELDRVSLNHSETLPDDHLPGSTVSDEK
jgi:hypothetical protein